ncbi:diaminopimelate decarboxylase [Synergistales bacterium]|nr:diaminopimelate decarboxylase [Synergistales bacterium]
MSHLLWGGADCVELARSYGTPLYVVDETIIRERCREIKSAFLSKWPDTSACYAGKAFLTLAMARIVEQEGLGLDVVSGGELLVAQRAAFPMNRVELHGNAKSERELRAALSLGVGRIIVDGIMELEVLSDLADEMERDANIMLRVSPGVAPHTHSYLVTGHQGSKFGLPLEGELLQNAVRLAVASKHVRLKGFHFHVGSQIFEPDSHVEAVKRVIALVDKLQKEYGIPTEELNFGGGYGVGQMPDVKGEPHVPVALFTDGMMTTLTRECEARGLRRPAVVIEPGRWVVGTAGITLYNIETIKRLDGVTYIGVDGGMPDNPRPSLYSAPYRAVLANKTDEEPLESVSIAGKCCETGDILIQSELLPTSVRRGDILAVFNTGAYNFSMATDYNRLGRPALVFVRNGEPCIAAYRRTEEDLLQGEVVPEMLR